MFIRSFSSSPILFFSWLLEIVGQKGITKLIGWNDDRYHELLEECSRRKQKNGRNGQRDEVEENGFGLNNILSEAVKDYVYKRSDYDDLKSDLKTLEDRSYQKDKRKASLSTSGNATSQSSTNADDEIIVNIPE
jgi:hypothetical protein